MNIILLICLVPVLCRSQSPQAHPGFYRDTVGDLESDPGWFYLWYLYKIFHPIRSGPEQTVKYFQNQSLDFGRGAPGAEPESKVKLVFAGDLMAKTGINLKNTQHLFDDLSAYIRSADLAFGNLESPSVPGRPTSVFPKYNLDPELVKRFQEAGFDVFSTANNHSLDQGPEGLVRTLESLDQIGLAHTGTARSPQERDQGFPILEVNGIKVAFLAYTFSTNGRGIPLDKPWMVNLIKFNLIGPEPDLSLVGKDIGTARELGAEIVVVSCHWGLEFEFYPPERIIERGHRIVELGADIIIGHHPHCLQPMEKYVPKNLGPRGLSQALIVYSLGNFIPDTLNPEFKISAVLGMELVKGKIAGKDQIRISKIEIVPTLFLSQSFPSQRFQIIRTDLALKSKAEPRYAFLTPKSLDQIQQAQALVEQILVPDGKSLSDFLPEN